MLDTVTIKAKYYNYDSISTLIESLDDASVKFNKNGTSLKTGSKNNVRLFLTGNMLAINFNPNKIVNGTNEIDAPFSCFDAVLTSLENWLGIDLHDAIVSRLDVGAAISVIEQPHNYLALLAHCSRAKKCTYKDETLTFIKGNRNAVFYDKKIESDAKNKSSKALQHNGNLLRFEVQLLKQPKRILKVPELTAGMLTDPLIIKKIMTLWQNSYLDIHKVVRPQANIDCSDTKSFVMSLANHGVDALGIDTVLSHVDSASAELSGMQRYRLMQKLFQITSFQTDQSTQILLDELSEKIQWIAANAT